MSPSVACYPQPGKARSRQVLQAFANGAKGAVLQNAGALEPRAAAFYGVVGIERLFTEARRSGRPYFYGDNAFFDACRGTHYRFTRGGFQPYEVGPPDWSRFEALKIKPRPWRPGGGHIVVVEQSEHFLWLSGAGVGWLESTVGELSKHTDRELRVRRWTRDKAKAVSTLHADLAGAWALVTHMSSAAVEAVLQGVPVFVTGLCAATPMASGALSDIETPKTPDGRRRWTAWLAGRQWTLDEMRSGMAWRWLS